MADHDHSPSPARVIGQRLRVVAAIRAVTVAAITVCLATWGSDLILDGAGAVAVAAGAGLAAFSLLVPLCPRSVDNALVDLSMVVDAAGLALLLYATGGAGSPFTPVVVLAVVLHLLAFGTRTGIRMGIVSTLALGWVWATTDARLLGDLPTSDLQADTRVLVTLMATWVAVASMGLLSRVVEADFRRAVQDRDRVRRVSRSMRTEEGADGVARHLVAALRSELGLADISVWLVRPGGQGVRLVSHTGGHHERPDRSAGSDPLIQQAMETATVVAGRPRRPLAALHAPPVLIVPLLRDDDAPLGVLVVGGIRSRSQRHQMESALLAVARDAGLALADAIELARLREQAQTDPLTGLANPRVMREQVDQELARAQRRWANGKDASLSFALFDLDHFKRVNDTHGHPVGDAVLIAVARAVSRAARGADLVCRHGGEEFAILLVDTPAHEAQLACERFRRVVSEVSVTTDDGTPLQVTASFGVATVSDPSIDARQLVHRADQALYRAKHEGRNRVAVAEDIATDADSVGDHAQRG